MNEQELILTSVLNCRRADLYLKDFTLDKSLLERLSLIELQRKKRIPLQYILRKTEFMGLEFKVDKRVFIPRPETEILVEVALDLINNFHLTTCRILDIGTGSGNIAVSLAKFFPGLKITAIDISKEALDVAKENAKLNGVEEAINFQCRDICEVFSRDNLSMFDIIISNPPYIPAEEINNLAPEVKYEPGTALKGGADGLFFHREIIKQSAKLLKTGGFLILEMGYNQSEEIEDLFINSGNFEVIKKIKDYQNIDRIIIGQMSTIPEFIPCLDPSLIGMGKVYPLGLNKLKFSPEEFSPAQQAGIPGTKSSEFHFVKFQRVRQF